MSTLLKATQKELDVLIGFGQGRQRRLAHHPL